MSNDIKNLADVEPGGRVRLGDQAERARFEDWGRAEGLPLARGKLGGYAFEITAKAWRAWQYLSAQPSPVAYHGDVDLKWLSGSIGEVAHRLSTYMPTGLAEWADRARDCRIAVQVLSELSAQPSQGGQDALASLPLYRLADDANGNRGLHRDDTGSWVKLQDLERALAARQPVGEPVDAIERIARLLYLRSCNRHADGSPYTEWEPMDDRIKDYYRKDAQDYEALRNCALWPAGRENYTAPPAQAVDTWSVIERVAKNWDGCSIGPAIRSEAEKVIGKPAQAVGLGTGIKAIASERERQLCIEGFSRDSDEQYREGELARAATAYVQLAAMDLQVGSRKHIASQEPPFFWPWAPEWWKPVDARHDLVRAGALIAAQIDLIDSKAAGNAS